MKNIDCFVPPCGVDCNKCYQCKIYPCARYRKFADSWIKLGDDLLKNQQEIKKHGAKRFLETRAK